MLTTRRILTKNPHLISVHLEPPAVKITSHMSNRVPLQPMNTTASRRKSRVCTREACETCRKKKAKCDGEQPCSRCESHSLECVYQIRNHRSKRSLRNELNVIKERQRLQENLLTALQDPQRKEAALQLLETDDPLAGAAKLLLKDDVDLDAHRITETFSSRVDDDGHRSTVGSTSPFSESATPQHTLPTSPRSSNTSPRRNNSNISNIQGADDYSMPPGSFAIGGAGSPFQQFPQSFPPTKGAPVIEYQSQPGGPPPSVFGLMPQQLMPWFDPSLTGGNNMPFPQHQQHSNPFQPMAGGNKLMWNGNGNGIGTGNPRGAMMPQEQPPHVLPPPNDSDAINFGHWNSPTVGDKKLPGPTSPPTSSDLLARARFTSRGSESQTSSTASTHRQHRASISSATSNGGPPRSQYRERHRQASARNWHKQKQATVDLQATKVRVEAQHAALKEEYSKALDQVQQVKHALLCHAGCNDPAIKMWLQREATGGSKKKSNTVNWSEGLREQSAWHIQLPPSSGHISRMLSRILPQQDS